MVHARIFAITRSETDTKDLVQECFVKVWLNRDKLPELNNFTYWLLRICYNHAISWLREKAIHDKSLPHYIDKYAIQESDHQTAEEIQLISLREVIRDTIHKMPPQQKKIYRLSREEGKNISEIAQELQLSPNTVKNRLVQALQVLRQAVERSGHPTIAIALLSWNIFSHR